MNAKARIIIVEDHTLLRAGLCAVLSRESDFEVVGEANNGRDAVRLAGTLSPQLMLMDLTMPGTNGVEAIVEIKRRHPKVRVLVLTLHKADAYIHESLRAGADGYILKEAGREELLVAMRSVLEGKTYLSPDISSQVVTGRLGIANGPERPNAWDTVSHRERQVLKLVAEGRTNKEIALYLCLSMKTVEKHRSNLMKKLELHNVQTLTAFAIEKGLIASEPRLQRSGKGVTGDQPV
jgi:DNA-binding NarL/FixJ family response regulator